MRVLAIDVGIKNMAFCYVDHPKVLWWENVNIQRDTEATKKPALEALIEDLLMALQDRFASDERFTTADVVLIENQPSLKNATMKTIAVAIFTFFVMLKLQHGTVREVRFMSPTSKLKCRRAVGLPQTSYKDRKTAAIEAARLYLTSDPSSPNNEHAVWFMQQKKRDDLADAFLMTQHHIESRRV
jgi:hypothetical protein